MRLLFFLFSLTLLSTPFDSLQAAIDFSGKDTIVEESQTISKDSAEKISRELLSRHPVFTDRWITDETFIYDDLTFDEIPEEVVIPLVRDGEQFKFTWYGSMSSGYKERWGRQHHGIDIPLQTGQDVYAAFDGIVRYAQYNNSGFGNCVVIRHLNGLETVYGHLSRILVYPNQFVKSGHVIGLGGNTGKSYGSHLHFETRYKDYSFDPQLFIDIQTQKLKTETLRIQKSMFTAYRYKGDNPFAGKKNIAVTSVTSYPSNINVDSSITSNPMAGSNDNKSKTSDSTIVLKTEAPVKTPTKPSIRKEQLVIATKPISVKINKKSTYVSVQKKPAAPRNAHVKIARVSSANPQKTIPKMVQKPATTTKKPISKTVTIKNKQIQKKGPVVKKPLPGKSYTIQAGDNLNTIAQKTGSSILSLRKLNKLPSDTKLMPGIKIRIK